MFTAHEELSQKHVAAKCLRIQFLSLITQFNMTFSAEKQKSSMLEQLKVTVISFLFSFSNIDKVILKVIIYISSVLNITV